MAVIYDPKAPSNYDSMALGKFNVDYEQRVDFDKMRKDKHDRAVKALTDDGYVCMVTFSADNIRYLTSAYITTPNRAGEYQFATFTCNGQATLYSGCPDEYNRRMPWMKGRVKDNIGSAIKTGAKDGNNLTIKKQVEAVINDIKEAGLNPNDGLIGIDGTAIPPAYIDGFEKAGLKCVMAYDCMDKARAIKTSEEIKIMRQVAANTEIAFTAIADAIRPGIKDCELVGIGLNALYAQGIDHSEDLVCMSGENTNPYNWTFTDKCIRPGDPIYIDIDAASYLGYKSCVYRTFYCGRPTDSQRDAYKLALDMLQRGTDACKNGNTNFDIQKAFKADPEKTWGHKDWAGIDPWCLAHGCGLTLHDRPFVAHTYMQNGGEEIPLEPGMVIAVETFAGMPNQRTGARLEDMVLITPEGGEIISRFPIEEPLVCWRDWQPNTRGILM